MKEKKIPALGMFYLPSTETFSNETNNLSKSSFEKRGLNIKNNKQNLNSNGKKIMELTDPEILNSFYRKKALNIPDYNRQLGRDNEEFQAIRKKNKNFSKEDPKTIEKRIEFHQYLTKKYKKEISLFFIFFFF